MVNHYYQLDLPNGLPVNVFHDFHTLTLLTTLQCPLECDHCIVEAGPMRRDHLEFDTAASVIQESVKLGVKKIGFTGGEPFLRSRELAILHQQVQAQKQESIIITSAFFATSYERAYAYLEPFRDVWMLGISTNSYHRNLTIITRVKTLIAAAHKLQIGRIEVQGINFGQQETVKEIKRLLGPEAEHVKIREQPIWPVGKAAATLPANSPSLIPLNNLDLACPMNGPTVTPDTRLHPCCFALLQLGSKNPLVMGLLREESLATIWSRGHADPYYLLLKHHGLGMLVALIRAAGELERLQGRYTCACHLCHEIHADSSLATFLRAAVIAANRKKCICPTNLKDL